MKHIILTTGAYACVAMAWSGCGADSAAGAPAPVVQPDSALVAQPAADTAIAFAALTGAIDEANNEVVSDADSSTSGAVSSGKARRSGNRSSTGTRVIDLDSVDGLGNDRWPLATGQLLVSWSGVETVSQPLGTTKVGEYEIKIIAQTPITYTVIKPSGTWTSTWTSGSTITYALDASGQYVGEELTSMTLHGRTTMTATELRVVDPQGRRSVIIGGGNKTFSVTLVNNNEENEVVQLDARADVSGTISTDNGPRHDWRWQRTGLDAYMFTWNGVVYGPYTGAQAVKYWKAVIE